MLTNAGTFLILATPTIAALLAQAEVQSIAQYGVLGAVLAWFMLRAEKLLAGIEHKMIGMNKTMLIWLLESQNTTPKAKQACRAELRKLDPDMADEIEG